MYIVKEDMYVNAVFVKWDCGVKSLSGLSGLFI